MVGDLTLWRELLEMFPEFPGGSEAEHAHAVEHAAFIKSRFKVVGHVTKAIKVLNQSVHPDREFLPGCRRLHAWTINRRKRNGEVSSEEEMMMVGAGSFRGLQICNPADSFPSS
jgi:hypothetical protein